MGGDTLTLPAHLRWPIWDALHTCSALRQGPFCRVEVGGAVSRRTPYASVSSSKSVPWAFLLSVGRDGHECAQSDAWL